MKVRNNLAQLRQRRGLPAAKLASLIGVSRQTVYAMEAGTFIPNTVVALNLAQALSVSVEDIYCLVNEGVPLHTREAELLPGVPELYAGQPVRLCRVDNRLMATFPEPGIWGLPTADGIVLHFGGTTKKTTVQVFEEDSTLNRRLLIAGCDPGISILAHHLLREGVDLMATNANSVRALELLKDGAIHIAGTHLGEGENGESNLAAVKKLFRAGTAGVFSFARWETGILTARENPKNIHSVADFGRSDVKIINREKGAGARLLLDAELRKAQIAPKDVAGYDEIAIGHLPAARRVRSGEVDCCLATKSAALVFGLNFIPLMTERYDLVIRRKHLKLPQIQAFLETLGRAAFRRELEGTGGYDASIAGDRIL
jgi:molybdate-binding protein/DNA-binding XRE family transcriptional regulator